MTENKLLDFGVKAKIEHRSKRENATYGKDDV
jgi:hypothetical protein